MNEARKNYSVEDYAAIAPDVSRNEPRRTEETLRNRSQVSTVLGICLTLLGLFAWGASAYTTLATLLFIGSVLVAGAIFQLLEAFRWRGWGRFFVHLSAGVLYAATGIMMWRAPLFGAASLTLLMAFFFIVTGLLRALGAASLRFANWGWAVASGVITTLLGFWVYANLPVASLYLIGALVGIELVLTGVSMVMLGAAGHRLTSRAA